MFERYGLLVLALRRKVDLPRGAGAVGSARDRSGGPPQDPPRLIVCNTPTCPAQGNGIRGGYERY